jgi:polyphosphate glucokinase
MKVLSIDIGGTNVKFLARGEKEPRKFPSGPTMTPAQMVSGVKKLASDWKYDRVSIGYPGLIQKGRIMREPHNLAPNWIGFDFEAAFGCPVRLINDAAMQALGSYEEGILLFLGLGTGLGSAFVVDGHVAPLELAHLPYKTHTYEYYIGNQGRKRLGLKKWKKHVYYITGVMIAALNPNDVVIGGGNVKNLKELPTGCRAGDNSYAFIGGFRMWEEKYSLASPKKKNDVNN